MKNLKILIIDSTVCSTLIKKLLYEFLELSEVIVVNNMIEAETLIKIKKKTFDLIIVNYHMSEMETIKKIKEISPESKIILMTAESTLEVKQAVKSTGADDFVERAFMEIDLERKIEKVFR